MSKSKKINLLAFLLILLASFVYFLPQLLFPQFNLIDDGQNLLVANELIKNPASFKENLIEKEISIGRMRPLYYIYYFVVYLIAGANPLAFWVGQALTFATTLYLIYLIVNYFVKNNPFSLLSVLPLLIIPSVAENFLRLGPAETRQMAFVLWGIYLFLKFINLKKVKINKILFLFSIWLIPIFIKEISIMFLAIYGIIFLFFSIVKMKNKKINIKLKNNKFLVLSFISFLLTIGAILMLPSSEGTYSSGLSFNLASAKNNFFIARISTPEFYWLFSIASLIWFTNLINLLKNLGKNSKKIIAGDLLIFGSALANLLLPLFWEHQLERYHYPAHIFVLIFFFVQIYRFLKWFDLNKKLHQKYIFNLLLLMFMVTRFIFIPSMLNFSKPMERYINQRRSWYEQYQYSGALINYLLSNDFSKKTIVMTHNDYEVVYELGIYASHLDIKGAGFKIISENKLTEERFGTPFIFMENIDDFKKDENSIIVKRSNYTDKDLVLWPEDPFLTDERQVWSIEENE